MADQQQQSQAQRNQWNSKGWGTDKRYNGDFGGVSQPNMGQASPPSPSYHNKKQVRQLFTPCLSCGYKYTWATREACHWCKAPVVRSVPRVQQHWSQPQGNWQEGSSWQTQLQTLADNPEVPTGVREYIRAEVVEPPTVRMPSSDLQSQESRLGKLRQQLTEVNDSIEEDTLQVGALNSKIIDSGDCKEKLEKEISQLEAKIKVAGAAISGLPGFCLPEVLCPLDEGLKNRMFALRGEWEAVAKAVAMANKQATDSAAAAGSSGVVRGDGGGAGSAAGEPDPKRGRVHDATQESLDLLEATLAAVDDDAMEIDDKAVVEAKQNGESARLAILEAQQAAAAASEKLVLLNEQGNKAARAYKQIKENHRKENGPYGRDGGKGGLPASGGEDSSLG